MTLTCDMIREAQARLQPHLTPSPSDHSLTLSDITGAQIYLKFENLQFTGSFKERGALNKLLQLTEEERKRGVIAMSAGNHARAVAYHGRRLGIPTVIVMPETTPYIKVRNTRRYTDRVVLKGASLTEAAEEAQRLATAEGLALVHPYDDWQVMAGQGTLALEFVDEFPELDVLVVPVGGGGLIAGVAMAAKDCKPGIEVIGVETELYPAMRQAINGGEAPVGGNSIADGIAVKNPGQLTRQVVRDKVDDLLVVSEDTVERAIVTMLEIEKVVVEGAGAVPLAAVLQHGNRFKGRKVGLILSGGNVDLRILASSIMRGLASDGRIAVVQVRVPDHPGALAGITAAIAAHNANVIEVDHHRQFANVSLRETLITVTIEVESAEHTAQILGSLAKAGFNAWQLVGEAAGRPSEGN